MAIPQSLKALVLWELVWCPVRGFSRRFTSQNDLGVLVSWGCLQKCSQGSSMVGSVALLAGRRYLKEGTPVSLCRPIRLFKQWSPRYWNFLRNFLLGEGKGWSLVPARKGTCLLGRGFMKLWQLTGSSCKTNWVLDIEGLMYDCLLTYISCLPFGIKPHVGTGGVGIGSLFLLFLMWPHWYISLLTVTYLFSWITRDEWLGLALTGSDPNDTVTAGQEEKQPLKLLCVKQKWQGHHTGSNQPGNGSSHASPPPW